MAYRIKKNSTGSISILDEDGSFIKNMSSTNYILKEGNRFKIGNFKIGDINWVELDTERDEIIELIYKDGHTVDPLTLTDEQFADILIKDFFDNRSDVFTENKTSPALMLKFNKHNDRTNLSTVTAIGDTVINVVDPTKIAIGDYLIIFSPVIDRYTAATALSGGANPIILDTPLDVAFPIGANIDVTTTNMAVAGTLGSPQIFGLRGVTPIPEGIEFTVDVTRVIFSCVTDEAVDLTKFGDIVDGLVNGFVLRKRDGDYYNIFNVKTNAELAGILYDFTISQALNPAQGRNGFIARLTFSGQEKMGVAIRLPLGQDLEFLVQDDLSSIASLEVVAEGHVVQ
jgi:hypothetical protein